MVLEDLVRKVNKELRAIFAESTQAGDNPRFVRLLDSMIQLTDVDELGKESEREKSDDEIPEAKSEPVKSVAPVHHQGNFAARYAAEQAEQKEWDLSHPKF